MKLISNASDALKMSSVQIAGVGAVLAIADQLLPTLQAVIPPVAYAVLFGLVGLARIILQPKLIK